MKKMKKMKGRVRASVAMLRVGLRDGHRFTGDSCDRPERLPSDAEAGDYGG